MKLTDQLMIVANAYAKARGLSRARISTIVFNQGQRLDRIADGARISTEKFEAAMVWFSTNWPAGADWPSHVPRPEVGGAGNPTPFRMAAGAV